MLYAGVIAGELINIEISHIDFLTSHLTVLGKGGKIREIPIKAELKLLMKEYLETERKQSKFIDSPFLFTSERSQKMDRDTTNKLLKRMRKDLKIQIFSHKFRHTFATKLTKVKRVNMTTIANLIVHSNIQTTVLFYVNTYREEKQDAINLLEDLLSTNELDKRSILFAKVQKKAVIKNTSSITVLVRLKR